MTPPLERSRLVPNTVRLDSPATLRSAWPSRGRTHLVSNGTIEDPESHEGQTWMDSAHFPTIASTIISTTGEFGHTATTVEPLYVHPWLAPTVRRPRLIPHSINPTTSAPIRTACLDRRGVPRGLKPAPRRNARFVNHGNTPSKTPFPMVVAR